MTSSLMYEVREDNVDLNRLVWRVAATLFQSTSVEDYADDLPERQMDIDGLSEAQSKLDKLAATTDEALEAEENRRVAEGEAKYTAEVARRAALRVRYEDIKSRVLQWKPPTENHEILKEHVLSAIESDLGYDCRPIDRANYTWSPRSAAEIRKDEVEHLTWELRRYTQNITVSHEHRASMRNYLTKLEESLPKPKDL